jgi:hypothetical protein
VSQDSSGNGHAELVPLGGDCAGPISGRVVTGGSTPLAGVCVFLLEADQGGVALAITGADGSYRFDAAPVDVDLVVGFLPPFIGPDGPCQPGNGPPPTPPAGALQPVAYRDVFIDLSNPTLLQNPFAVLVAAGAQTVRAGATGIDACLTSAPGTQVPRPSCVSATPIASPALMLAPRFTG